MQNNKYDNQYINIMMNDNVSEKDGGGREFFKLIALTLGVFFAIFLTVEFGMNIYITCMSPESQVKFEETLTYFGGANLRRHGAGKHKEKLAQLEKIKSEIIASDKTLQNRSRLPIYELNSKDFNAFVAPDGSIYFTSALLEEVKSEEALAFVLAHELGHYKYRHHLKAFSRGIAFFMASIVFSGNETSSRVTGGTQNIAKVKYSQRQELQADAYANKLIKSRYGSNKAAIDFFKYINEKEKNSEFLYFFSTHPSPKDRIRAISRR